MHVKSCGKSLNHELTNDELALVVLVLLCVLTDVAALPFLPFRSSTGMCKNSAWGGLTVVLWCRMISMFSFVVAKYLLPPKRWAFTNDFLILVKFHLAGPLGSLVA